MVEGSPSSSPQWAFFCAQRHFNGKNTTLLYILVIGEETGLDIPHPGVKVLHILTLMWQKVVGGLPNKYFKNNKAAANNLK